MLKMKIKLKNFKQNLLTTILKLFLNLWRRSEFKEKKVLILLSYINMDVTFLKSTIKQFIAALGTLQNDIDGFCLIFNF